MNPVIYWDYSYDEIPSIDLKTEKEILARFFLDKDESPKEKVKLAETYIEKYNNQILSYNDIANLTPKGLMPKEVMWPYINPYFRNFVRGAVCIGFLPGLDKSPQAMTYYTVRTTHPDFPQVSPVWIIEGVLGDYKTYFLSDHEESFIVKHEKVHGKYVVTDMPDSNRKQYIMERPVALYFCGCDDGSSGLRFKTKEEAMSYLSKIFVYEEIFWNEPKLTYYN